MPNGTLMVPRGTPAPLNATCILSLTQILCGTYYMQHSYQGGASVRGDLRQPATRAQARLPCHGRAGPARARAIRLHATPVARRARARGRRGDALSAAPAARVARTPGERVARRG